MALGKGPLKAVCTGAGSGVSLHNNSLNFHLPAQPNLAFCVRSLQSRNFFCDLGLRFKVCILAQIHGLQVWISQIEAL